MLIDIVGHFEKSLLFVLRDEQMDIEHEQMTTDWNQVHRYPVQRPNYRCLAKAFLGKKAVTTFGRIHNNADDNYYNDDDENDADDDNDDDDDKM